MRAIDTNVLVRLIVRDNVDQTASAEAFVSSGAWASHVVLLETVWVLESLYKKTRVDIGNVIERLIDHESLIVQDADVVTLALEEFRRTRKVEFADCLILAIARKHGHAPLGTFDVRLGRLNNVELI